MNNFKLLHNLIKYVDNVNSKNDADPILQGLTADEPIAYRCVSESDCIKILTKSKITDTDARKIIDLALSTEFQYLKLEKREADKTRYFAVTGKGLVFLERILFFNIGMWRDLFQHYASFGLLLSIFALLVSIIALIRSW